MKILHVAPSYYPATYYGGTIVTTHALCNELAKLPGIELRVLTTDMAGLGLADRLPVTGVPMHYPGGYDVYFARRRIRPDIAPGLLAMLWGMIGWADGVLLTGTYSFPTIPTLTGDWIQGPFRQPFGGSRFNNALWLDIIAKAYSPEVIIDSGTFQGASAWALSRGAPDAKVFSFDIDLSNLLWRSAKVDFREQDWTAMSLALRGRRNLAYFDDHVDQVRRLLEAANLGVSIAIFDDDFSVTSFASMAHNGASLPKVEFVLDETLADGEELTWIARSKLQRWRVDRSYLDLAKKTIKATERLPNLSMINGIWQTTYRICTLV